MFSMIGAVIGALALSASFTPTVATKRGLAWATDDRFAGTISAMPRIEWMHHWADGHVNQMNSKVEQVPMFWGPSNWGKWNTRVSEMKKKKPGHLMAFNEPDISSQSNMNPYYAAQLFMEQIYPWSYQGVKVGTPAIAFNLDWMQTFLSEVRNKGGHVDFMCIHWYGSWNDLNGFKKFVNTAHSRFNIGIWVTEIGITTGSNPSQAQVKNFMMNAFSWMDTQSFVQRAAWFGAFESNKAPDGFATGRNALLKPGGQPGDMAYWYGYSSTPDKRSHAARHHLSTREEDAVDESIVAEHCDKICVDRNAQIEKWEKTVAAREAGAEVVEGLE